MDDIFNSGINKNDNIHITSKAQQNHGLTNVQSKLQSKCLVIIKREERKKFIKLHKFYLSNGFICLTFIRFINFSFSWVDNILQFFDLVSFLDIDRYSNKVKENINIMNRIKACRLHAVLFLGRFSCCKIVGPTA